MMTAASRMRKSQLTQETKPGVAASARQPYANGYLCIRRAVRYVHAFGKQFGRVAGNGRNAVKERHTRNRIPKFGESVEDAGRTQRTSSISVNQSIDAPEDLRPTTIARGGAAAVSAWRGGVSTLTGGLPLYAVAGLRGMGFMGRAPGTP